jgi:catechol 2,3-dioxygenase-like lactoylglutathione lyase family enzyme
MTVTLDHTIVWAGDKAATASFLAHVLGLEVGAQDGPFLPIALGNGVTLDVADAPGPIASQHYAFALDDAAFDAAFSRLRAGGVRYWADPFHRRPDDTYREGDVRGVYFADPAGHNMELLTTGAPR